MADDYAGSTATTGRVSIGGSTIGLIETAGDTDWFRVTLVAGTTYVLELRGSPTGDGSLADPFLRLRDGAGNSISYDDDSGTGYNSRIEYTASASGTFFLSAGSSVTSQAGSYRISATQIGSPPPTDDYAGSTATTGTVAIGKSTNGSIEAAGDTDWFRVSLVAGAHYAFDLRGSPTSDGSLSDPFLRLRDGSGNSITYDDDGGSGANAHLEFTAQTSGSYFLSAGSSVSSGTGTYRVSAVQTSSPPTDDYAGSTATTGKVAVGGSVGGTIETAGDTDWFKVTLAAGQSYVFDLAGRDTGNGSLADPFLRLRDAAGNSVAFDDDAGTGLNSHLAYTTAAGGTFFLSVGSSASGGTGTYRLTAAETVAASQILLRTPVSVADDTGSRAWTITQAPGGTRSHKDQLYESWDFAAPSSESAGSKINPVYAGTVVAFRDSVSANGDRTGGGIGNYITLEHHVGNITFYTSYFHLLQSSIPDYLEHQGVKVTVNDVIGLLGNTGVSDGPHIHINIGFDKIQYGSKNPASTIADGSRDPRIEDVFGFRDSTRSDHSLQLGDTITSSSPEPIYRTGTMAHGDWHWAPQVGSELLPALHLA